MSAFDIIKERIQNAMDIKSIMIRDSKLLEKIELLANKMVTCYNNGNKVLFCGNGGSAADAQHLAAELSGRFYKERPPLNAEALHVNSSFITASSNDYSFEHAYERLIEAKAKKGDILVAISTSGNSINIIRAVEKAKELGIFSAGLSGNSGGILRDKCDLIIQVPSDDTARIQESHILIGHIVCEIVEAKLFP